MTHRVFSRNASSSRAIPTSKLIEEVKSDALRASPVFWGKNQKGMQAAEELSDEKFGEFYERMGISEMEHAKNLWETAAYHAARYAELMNEHGVHKQIVNRILEPFSHINVVATSTEWTNFFCLRLDKEAQPEMRALAIEMWKEYNNSVPKILFPGQWHLPFNPDSGSKYNDVDLKISAARCARVSYESFETGKLSTIAEDVALCDKLLSSRPLHASPAEHQATPDQKYDSGEWMHPEKHGNLVGWCQYRKYLPNENMNELPSGF